MKLFITLILLLSTACSSTINMSKKERDIAFIDYIEANKLVSLKKVTAFKFHGWQSLTNEHLIMSSSVNKRFLIKLNASCPDLRFAQTILVDQSMSSSLSVRFDSISVVGPAAVRVKCFIKSIYPISKEQAKEISAIGKVSDHNET